MIKKRIFNKVVGLGYIKKIGDCVFYSSAPFKNCDSTELGSAPKLETDPELEKLFGELDILAGRSDNSQESVQTPIKEPCIQLQGLSSTEDENTESALQFVADALEHGGLQPSAVPEKEKIGGQLRRIKGF